MDNAEHEEDQESIRSIPSPPNSTTVSIPNSPPRRHSRPKPSAALTPPRSPSIPSQTCNIDIVVAHYNESLTWLSPFASSCHVYSKGNQPPPPQSIATSPVYKSLNSLPNIGRETHTYLTHIVSHYDTLPPYLLLLQGDIHTINHGTPAHTDLTLSEIIRLTTSLTSTQVLPIGLIKSFSDWDALVYKDGWLERRGQTLVCSKLNPGEFWRWMFSGTAGNDDAGNGYDDGSSSSSSRLTDLPEGNLPESVRFVQGACFGLTREAILRRPRSFYERILRYFEELDEVDPEEGHYMERFWYCVLSDEAIGKSA